MVVGLFVLAVVLFGGIALMYSSQQRKRAENDRKYRVELGKRMAPATTFSKSSYSGGGYARTASTPAKSSPAPATRTYTPQPSTDDETARLILLNALNSPSGYAAGTVTLPEQEYVAPTPVASKSSWDKEESYSPSSSYTSSYSSSSSSDSESTSRSSYSSSYSSSSSDSSYSSSSSDSSYSSSSSD